MLYVSYMEGVEAKIEWQINEDCLMEFRTRRSGGFARRSGYCGGGFQLSTILPATIRSWRAGWWSVFPVLRIDE